MRRAIRFLFLGAVMAVVWAPAPAQAEGFISPWAGVNFGDEEIEGKGSFGVTGGWMGAGVIGGEVLFGYSPDIFGDAIGNSAIDLMGNVIVGVPLGGTSGVGVRPFGSAGIGLLRTSIDGLGSLDPLDDNSLGFNVGAGVMGFFNDHVGMRGEIRYFRDINADDEGPGVTVDLGAFDFWRASIGVVFR
jgi:hypothetical protein